MRLVKVVFTEATHFGRMSTTYGDPVSKVMLLRPEIPAKRCACSYVRLALTRMCCNECLPWRPRRKDGRTLGVHVKETRLWQMSMVRTQSRMNSGCMTDLLLGTARMSENAMSRHNRVNAWVSRTDVPYMGG